MTKICTTCQEEKDTSQFSNNKSKSDGLHTKCKGCHSAYLKNHYQANKAYYISKARVSKVAAFKRATGLVREYLLAHPCVDCGERDPRVLEFDHVRGEKVLTISQLATSRGAANDRILDEIAKCDVRCANCHRRKTAKQFGWA